MANFWESVVKLNDWHQHRISKLIVKKLFGTLSEKKICILGFSFKANTNDTRESSAINICKDLLDEGAILNIHDPKVCPNQIAKDLGINQINNNTDQINNSGKWEFFNSIEEAASGVHAILVLTEWEEYSKIQWKSIAKKMISPAWVFDSRSILISKEVVAANLNLWRIGDGS